MPDGQTAKQGKYITNIKGRFIAERPFCTHKNIFKNITEYVLTYYGICYIIKTVKEVTKS
jgi:hypothetical protein